MIWWCVLMYYLTMCHIKMCYLKMCDLKRCYIKMWYLTMILVKDVYLSSRLKMCICWVITWYSYIHGQSDLKCDLKMGDKSVTYLWYPKPVPHAYRVELGTLHSLSSIFEDVVYLKMWWIWLYISRMCNLWIIWWCVI